MIDLWQSAAGLNAHLLTDKQRACGEEYVPWRAIEIRYDILPRDARVPAVEKVEQYAASFDDLPAIAVQKDSFILIDGLTRLSAAQGPAGRDHIRIRERAVADQDLRLEAFRANISHGQPLTLGERKAMAEWLLRTHPDDPAWSSVEIARQCSLERHTVYALRDRMTRSRGTVETTAPAPLDHQAPTDAPPPVAGPPIPPAPAQRGGSGAGASPRPSPSSPAAKARTTREETDLAHAYAYAQVLFGNHRPAELAGLVAPARRAEVVAELRGWRRWVDELLAAIEQGDGEDTPW